MKIKLDENIHADAKDALSRRGHEVMTAHDEGLGGRPDDVLAAMVKAEGRCLVTFDLEFGDVRRYPPTEYAGIVVLRLRVPTSRVQVRRLSSFFASSPVVEGRLWVVDETRARDWTS